MKGAFSSGAAECGLQPGACLLRLGRHPAYRHRRKPCPGPSQPRLFPRGATSPSTRRRRREAIRSTWRTRWATLEEAALGIIRIVNANMAKGISGDSVQKGYDLREFILVPSAGPRRITRSPSPRNWASRKIVVPPMCGNFSAVGLAVADIQHDYVRTVARRHRSSAPTDLPSFQTHGDGGSGSSKART